MGIGAVRNDKEWHWISEHLGAYIPLCRRLEAELGTEFLIESVGSAGYAIVGLFVGDLKVMLTKAVGPLETYAEHAHLDACGQAAGWAAAVYSAADDYCEPIAWADDPDMSITDFEGACLMVKNVCVSCGIS